MRATTSDPCPQGHGAEARFRRPSGKLECRECSRARSRRRWEKIGRARNAERRVDGGKYQPGNGGYRGLREGFVENKLLRECVEREMRLDRDLGWEDIALRADWYTTTGSGEKKGDTTKVQRAVGLRSSKKDGRETFAWQCREETALAIARAIHVDPWEVGL